MISVLEDLKVEEEMCINQQLRYNEKGAKKNSS